MCCAVDLLRCEELVCRAWDETMNTQPNMLTWNVMGELRVYWKPSAMCQSVENQPLPFGWLCAHALS